MITRSQAKSLPLTHTSLTAIATNAKVPKSLKEALSAPHWLTTMQEELRALHRNDTWSLVPRTSSMNIVGSKWVFKTKMKLDGSIERHKARLVAKGYSQLEDIDFDETFSSVVKAITIRVILSIVVTLHWPIKQLDAKNAFLHGHLQEEVLMSQPPGFINSKYPDHVCLLKRALYGLKQAPRAWFERFSLFLLYLGFKCSRAGSSLFTLHSSALFTLHSSAGTILLLLYVDDIIVTRSNSKQTGEVVEKLGAEFAMKDLGRLSYFLGIEVNHFLGGIHLTQTKYASDLLKKVDMASVKAAHTPLVQKHGLQESVGNTIEGV